MANPRVRFDDEGEPKPCVVKVPPHLSKILYHAALLARQGKGGLHVEETDIVIKLIEKWAESQPVIEWSAVVNDLKTEADAEAAKAQKQKGKKARKASG